MANTDLESKTCTKCKQIKALSEFYWATGRKAPRSHCKACDIATASKWKQTNKERAAATFRSWDLKRKYGIDSSIYASMLKEQDGRCAICSTTDPKGPWGVLVIDHDHETGKIRQLLCHGCNTGLGKFKEDPDLLMIAALYLIRHHDNK